MKFSVKGKHRVLQFRNGLVLLFLVFSVFQSRAQQVVSDTLLAAPQDSALVLDSLTDTVDTAQFSGEVPVSDSESAASDINTTINYQANDSIDFDVVNRILYLYGDAKIDYGAIKLDAAYIEYNWGTNMMQAYGVPDTTGKITGKPLFKDGDQAYETDSIRYNFISQKALISGVVTEQGEGIIQAELVKKNADGSANMGNILYTTCNLAEPHFHIEADKIKMLPGDKILAGPFHLEVANIPTPLGFLFGMFPIQKENEAGSGIIIPKYGEEYRRGYFLREGGYYFAISEYMDIRLTGSIYSRGSYNVDLNSNYRKRYAYNGNVSIQYSNQRLGENIEDSTRNSDIWVRWSHNPVARGNSRLSANVSAGTSGFNQLNPTTNLQNTLRQEFNSNVNYSTSFFRNRLNFSTSFRLNQNVRTRKADILLPEVSLGMNRIYPFKKAGGSGKTWYEKINMSWNFNATNRLTNVLDIKASDGQDSIAEFNAESIPIIFRNSNNGGQHRIPISTSFNLFKYIAVSPSINLTEYWYLKKLDWRYDPETNSAVADTINGFSRAFEYNASAGFTTRIYGTFPARGKFKELTGVQAVRHVIIPTVSLSYRPNFAGDNYDIYQSVQTDSLSDELQLRSRYQGFVFGSPGSGESGNISFSLNNNVEMKVLDKSDSTGEATKKVPLLENLQLSTSYNILADSFRLAPIRLSTRTRLFDNKVNINLSTTIDPYYWRLDSVVYNSKGEEVSYAQRFNRLAVTQGQGFGRITNARIAISTTLRPDKKGSRSQSGIEEELGDDAERYMQEEIQDILNNPDLYVDWSVPWSLSINYNIDFNQRGFEEPTIRQTLRFNGDVSLSENWKLNFRSGYDIQARKLINQTNISLLRNLHCWELRFNYTPFGDFANYSVDLQVKASILQDLKLSRRRSRFDSF